MNRRKARREVRWSLCVEEPIGPGQNFLSPRDPLLHCRVRGHEGTRDLVNAKTAQDMKDEHDLRFFGQARMAAGEHHAELVVFDCVVGKHFLYNGCECPLALKKST